MVGTLRDPTTPPPPSPPGCSLFCRHHPHHHLPQTAGAFASGQALRVPRRGKKPLSAGGRVGVARHYPLRHVRALRCRARTCLGGGSLVGSGVVALLPSRQTPPPQTRSLQRGLFPIVASTLRISPSFEKRCLPVFASLPRAAIMQTPAALFIGFAAPSRQPKPHGGGQCPRPPYGRGWRLPRGATLRCYAFPLVLPAFLRLGPAATGFCRYRQKGCFSTFCLLRAAARLVSLCAWATRAVALGAPFLSASCARGPPPRACGLGGSPPLLALPHFRRASHSGRAPPRRAGLREGGVPPQGAGRFFRLARSRIQGQSGLRPLPLP